MLRGIRKHLESLRCAEDSGRETAAEGVQGDASPCYSAEGGKLVLRNDDEVKNISKEAH